MVSLRILYLNNNCFSYTGGIGFDFTNQLPLEYIDLSLNNLTQLPEDILDLENLQEVKLNGNPILSGIPDYIFEQGFNSIYHFIEEVRKSRKTESVLEAKLIFVGQGEVGKTSLMKKIIDTKETIVEGKEPTTHGINIRKWNQIIFFSDSELLRFFGEGLYDHYDEDYDEDFEGYQNQSFSQSADTYKMEYDDHSLEYSNIDYSPSDETEDDMNFIKNSNSESFPFALYSNDEHDSSLNNTDEVVNNQKTAKFNIWDFGGQEIYYSTHQFFLTKRSIYIFVWDARREEDYRGFLYWFNTINILSEKSPIIIVMNKSDVREKNIDEAILKENFPNIVSFCRTSCITNSGIEELKQLINIAFKKLPHIGDRLPIAWLNVRNHLVQLKQNYISYDSYVTICKTYKIYAQRADLLSDYLHDLGDILHFQNDEMLRRIVILNPDWVTNAFYRLIDNKKIQTDNGRFLFSDLSRIWNIDVHPVDKHLELIRLIENFELCFNIVGSREYILPELLQSTPNYLPVYTTKKGDTKFDYIFNFMPSGIMTRFICRNFLSIEKNIFWKNGVVIRYEESLALITEDILNKKISILINGDDRTALLGVIRKEFNFIFDTLKLSNDSEYFEMVPCNCDYCTESIKPHFFKFNVLKKFLKKGKVTYLCPISADDVVLTELVKGYEKIKHSEKILDHLIIACSQLQGNHKIQISGREDDRNNIIATALHNRGIVAKDQTRWGSSASNKSQGEIDIKLESTNGNILGICEGFNLSYIETAKIHLHLEKIFNYDPNGLESNYIVVYSDSNDFVSLWEKYQDVAITANYKYKIINGFIDITNNYTYGRNIKLGKTSFSINNSKTSIYHIFVNMNL